MSHGQVYPAIANTRGRVCFYHPAYRPPGHSQVASQYEQAAHTISPFESYHKMTESPGYGLVSSQCTETAYGSSQVPPFKTVDNNYMNLNFDEVNTPFASTLNRPYGRSIESSGTPQALFAFS
jgi:hypothetical protein